MIWPVWCIFKRNAKHSNSEVCKYFASYFDLLWRSANDTGEKQECFLFNSYNDNLRPLASLKKNLLLEPGIYCSRSLSLKHRVIVSDRFKTTTTAQGQTAQFLFILDHWSSEEQKRLKLAFTTFFNRLKSGRRSLFPWRMRWICSVMSLLIPRVQI